MATQVGIFLLAICSFVYCDANFLDYQPIKLGIYPNNGQRTSFGRCREGEEQRRGSFVFRCQGGNLVPSACVMQDGNQIPIGQLRPHSTGWHMPDKQDPFGNYSNN
uniref:Secreted protein n=1 Tax=Romanomermis culicivorax TaxID=13658 RepID=A0A915KKK6_ROMCU